MKHAWRGLSLDRLLHSGSIEQRRNVQQLRDSLALYPRTSQPIEVEDGIEKIATQISDPAKFEEPRGRRKQTRNRGRRRRGGRGLPTVRWLKRIKSRPEFR